MVQTRYVVAIFTVKPSRGTILFFGLLALGLTVRYGYNRHEQNVVSRDAPLTHSARRLLRCVLGRDADQLLWPRAPNDDVRPWAQTLNSRLRSIVTEHYSATWPAQCVPMAQRVAERLSSSNIGGRSYALAAESLRLLNSMTTSRNGAIAVAENGRLGVSLASLSLELIKASTGSESGWNSGLAYEPMDLFPVRSAQVPLGNALPRGADVSTFAAPEWILYQDIADRRTHAMLFRPSGAPLDVVVGPGAPLRVPNNSGATLLASDDSDALLPLETSRPSPIALPPPVRSGLHHIQSWQSVKSNGHRWFAYTDEGRVHVWSVREGSSNWEERVPPQFQSIPVAAIALVGDQEAAGPAGTSPNPPANTLANTLPGPLAVGAANAAQEAVGLRAYVLRYVVHGLALERWDFAPPATQPVAAVPANNTAVAAVPTVIAPGAPQTALAVIGNTQEPLRRTVLSGETQSLHRPRIRVCVSETRVHFAVIADETYAFYSADVNDVHTGSLAATRTGALAGGRAEFSCDRQRSLLLADLAGRPGALVQYDGAGEPKLLSVPLPELTLDRRVDGAALVSGGVLAIVRTPSSVRSFVTVDGFSWQGGALIAALEDPTVSPVDHPEIPANPGYSVIVNAVSSYRDRVAALALARGRSSRAIRFTSDDSGITWH